MRILIVAVGLTLVTAFAAGAAEDAAKPAGKASAGAAKQAAPKAKAGNAKAAAGKGGGLPSDEQIADQLKAFCMKWMGFLETRERDNKKGIKWEKQPTGMAGHYVGYSKEYDCVMKERSSNGTPVATIVYKEFIYEKTGPSQGEAEQDDPAVIDATEVTEIFRYSKGDWVY